MSLLDDTQREATDANTSVSALLRRCQILAYRDFAPVWAPSKWIPDPELTEWIRVLSRVFYAQTAVLRPVFSGASIDRSGA